MTTRSIGTAAKKAEADLYERDFFLWTEQTAQLLRERRVAHIDAGHLAEEIEDMGKRDLRELQNRIEVLFLHLLKWQVQKGKRSRSWRSTILAQRFRIQAILDDSPSLRSKLLQSLDKNYAKALQRALTETGLKADRFPSTCPYTWEQVLDTKFLPS